MQQGESPDGKGYIITSGNIEVLVDDEVVATLKDGDIVGEMALMSEEERTATVVATSDLETIVLSQEDIFTMIENDQNTINKEIMRRMEENLER
jgi:cGMP-dependent protein kinase